MCMVSLLLFFQIVDPFHFPNHTDSLCKERYNPEQIRKDHPHWNMMCAEQTFVWLSRYKKNDLFYEQNTSHACFFCTDRSHTEISTHMLVTQLEESHCFRKLTKTGLNMSRSLLYNIFIL